jgi:hypothetical protein
MISETYEAMFHGRVPEDNDFFAGVSIHRTWNELLFALPGLSYTLVEHPIEGFIAKYNEVSADPRFTVHFTESLKDARGNVTTNLGEAVSGGVRDIIKRFLPDPMTHEQLAAQHRVAAFVFFGTTEVPMGYDSPCEASIIGFENYSPLMRRHVDDSPMFFDDLSIALSANNYTYGCIKHSNFESFGLSITIENLCPKPLEQLQ